MRKQGSLNSKGAIAFINGKKKLCKEVLIRVVGRELKNVEASVRHWKLRHRAVSDTDCEGWTQVLEASKWRGTKTGDEGEETLLFAVTENAQSLPEPPNHRRIKGEHCVSPEVLNVNLSNTAATHHHELTRAEHHRVIITKNTNKAIPEPCEVLSHCTLQTVLGKLIV